VRVFHSKMAAAAVSAFFTAIGGSFYALFVSYIDPDSVLAFQFSLLGRHRHALGSGARRRDPDPDHRAHAQLRGRHRSRHRSRTLCARQFAAWKLPASIKGGPRDSPRPRIRALEQRLVECLEIADRAYVLQTGRVVMSGTAAEIARNADVRRAYLGL